MAYPWYDESLYRYPGAVPGAVPGAAPPPFAGGGYGLSTPQERAYHMENMPDISAKKRALARQQALSEELRQSAVPTRRMDWASQAARGLSGIGSALIDERSRGEEDTLSAAIRRHWRNAPGMRDPDEERDWGV